MHIYIYYIIIFIIISYIQVSYIYIYRIYGANALPNIAEKRKHFSVRKTLTLCRGRTSNGLMIGLEIVWLVSEDGIQKQGQGGVP